MNVIIKNGMQLLYDKTLKQSTTTFIKSTGKIGKYNNIVYFAGAFPNGLNLFTGYLIRVQTKINI